MGPIRGSLYTHDSPFPTYAASVASHAHTTRRGDRQRRERRTERAVEVGLPRHHLLVRATTGEVVTRRTELRRRGGSLVPVQRVEQLPLPQVPHLCLSQQSPAKLCVQWFSVEVANRPAFPASRSQFRPLSGGRMSIASMDVKCRQPSDVP